MSDLPVQTEKTTGPVAERYQLIRELGEGGFGRVYYAEDLKFKPPRPVALKLLHPRYAITPQIQEDFEREASILAQLNHPNILRVLDFGITANTPFIVTELAGGGSLAQKMGISYGVGRPLPLEEVACYLEQITAGLEEAHSKGLAHRDIKPQNILLDQSGRVLLADFGLALTVGTDRTKDLIDATALSKALDPQSPNPGASTTINPTASASASTVSKDNPSPQPEKVAAELTGAMLPVPPAKDKEVSSQEGSVPPIVIAGTPLYMAPEMWRGYIARASDIYALGVMLYQMITGYPPFQGSQTELMFQHFNSLVPSLAQHAPDLKYSPALDQVIAQAMHKNAAYRPNPPTELYRRFKTAMEQTILRPLPTNSLNWSSPAYAGTSRVTFNAVSPNHKIVACGYNTGTIRLWEVATGQLLLTLNDHSGLVYLISFSSDGQLLISNAEDGLTKIWDIANGQEISCLQ